MQNADIGIYGLGTMGSALALNLADNGFCVAVTNREPEWIAPFLDKAGPLADRLVPAETLESFVAALQPPRAILMMIPSGAPVAQLLAGVMVNPPAQFTGISPVAKAVSLEVQSTVLVL